MLLISYNNGKSDVLFDIVDMSNIEMRMGYIDVGDGYC